MTWITDNKGTRWVESIPRQRRKPPQPKRFKNLKVGDQLMQKPKEHWHRGLPRYIIITDMWFDPVAGQHDPVAGQMVGYCPIKQDGEIHPEKSSTTIRGLASQQYHYADIDYITHCKSRCDAIDKGSVVGIGYGNVLRRRPKTPGGSNL
jgi:hypothetical protein